MGNILIGVRKCHRGNIEQAKDDFRKLNLQTQEDYR